MPPLQIFQDKKDPQAWRVEDNDADGDGDGATATFRSNPSAPE